MQGRKIVKHIIHRHDAIAGSNNSTKASELLPELPSQSILVSFNECRRHDRIDIVDLGNNTSGLHLLLSLVTMN